MLWRGRRESSNVDDRRGIGGGGIAVGGGILGVIALLVNFLLGGDGSTQLPLPNQNEPLSAEQQAKQDSQAKFVKVVLAETEDVWNQVLPQAGINYAEPNLVLFSGSTQSACGFASSASGPFYCPGDQKVYIAAFKQTLAFYMIGPHTGKEICLQFEPDRIFIVFFF